MGRSGGNHRCGLAISAEGFEAYEAFEGCSYPSEMVTWVVWVTGFP